MEQSHEMRGENMDKIKLLEDKLQYCQENLNFVAREIRWLKEKHEYPQNKYTTMDSVYIWLTDYHYETCEIKEIALHKDEPRYYLRRITSTLTGKYNYVSELWMPEHMVFGTLEQLKDYLKQRLDNLVK